MDSGSKTIGRAPVEDNIETNYVSVLSENSETFGESKVNKDGTVEDHGTELLHHVDGKGTELWVPVNSSSLEMKPSKGYGLKKWRRIKRDVTRGKNSSLGTGKMMMHELSNSVMNPSKRTQVYTEKQQKSEDSISSPIPVAGNFDASVDPPVDSVQMDSENGDDHSSRSSTATSFPQKKNGISVMEVPQDKGTLGNLGRDNRSYPEQLRQPGKDQAEATKNGIGKVAKFEKENSRSSMESDFRSPNFVFSLVDHATNNELQGENDRDVLDGKWGFANEGIELSRDFKNERGEHHGSLSDQDPVIKSMYLLQKAQESLEEEVQKFTEIGNSLENEISEQFTSEEEAPIFSPDLHSEEVKIAKRDLESELEDLFKQRIEAEVEYFAISRTLQNSRLHALAQSIIPVHQVLLEKGSEKLRGFSDEIVSIDSTLKLQKKACKYTTFFIVQLVSLFVMFGVVLLTLSSNRSDVVPT